MDGKKPMPSDPARRAVYQVQIARLEEKQQQRTERRERHRTRKQRRLRAPLQSPRTAASDTAKTAEELAAAAAASPDATPGDSNSMSAMSARTRNGTTSHSIGARQRERPWLPAEREAHARGRCRSPPPRRSSLRRLEDSGTHRSSRPTSATRKSWRCRPTTKSLSPTRCAAAKARNFSTGMEPKQKETLMAMNNPQARGAR